MALIKCSGCGTQISENAAACPQCGEPKKKRTSRLTWAVLALIVIGVGMRLTSPERAPSSASSAEYVPPPPSARAKLRAISKDPDSLQFRNERISTTDTSMSCGEMNGKNSFGGYVGYRRFIVSAGTVLIDDENHPKFNEAWQKFCSH